MFGYPVLIHSLHLLTNVYKDKKSAESVCLAFARLVDNYHKDERLLKEIAAHGLLSGIQQLVSVQNIVKIMINLNY